jgi:hypothetical protein
MVLLRTLALYPAFFLTLALTAGGAGPPAPAPKSGPEVQTVCVGERVRATTQVGGVRPGAVVLGDVRQRVRLGEGETPAADVRQECGPASAEAEAKAAEVLRRLGLVRE